MKVLLTGATGLIGQKLGHALVAKGHEVCCLVRDLQRARLELNFPAELFSWEGNEQLPAVGAVVHLAGEPIAAKSWTPEFKKRILNSRLDTTRVLLEKITKGVFPRPKVFLAASAIGYYGDRGEETLLEDAVPGEGFLPNVCVAWEQETQKAQTLVDRVVIVRIGMVLSRHGGALAEMLPVFQRGLAGRLGSGEQWVSWIHLDDLVNLFLFALENDQVKGVVNGVAPESVTNSELTALLANQLQAPVFLAAPKWGLRKVLGELSNLLLYSSKVSSEKIQSLGFRFGFRSLSTAFAEIFPECKKYGARLHILETEQWLPADPVSVFSFFSEAKNLSAITPSWLKFKILSQSKAKLKAGAKLAYRLRIHGVPVWWRTCIVKWQEPKLFIDEQEKGPYQLWHHTHQFIPLGKGTLMRDTVLYRLPGGYLGENLAQSLVQKDLHKIFSYRREKIAEKFPLQ